MSELMRNIRINGDLYSLAVSQYGNGSPQASTPGKPGVLYLNTANGNLYKCTAANPATGNYTWAAMSDAGGVFAASTKGAGAEEISVIGMRIGRPNVGFTLSIGDKLITTDNYLYEITALPEGIADGYSAKLIRNLNLSAAQIGALDALFQLTSYSGDATQALADFRSAFGISG